MLIVSYIDFVFFLYQPGKPLHRGSHNVTLSQLSWPSRNKKLTVDEPRRFSIRNDQGRDFLIK